MSGELLERARKLANLAADGAQARLDSPLAQAAAAQALVAVHNAVPVAQLGGDR